MKWNSVSHQKNGQVFTMWESGSFYLCLIFYMIHVQRNQTSKYPFFDENFENHSPHWHWKSMTCIQASQIPNYPFFDENPSPHWHCTCCKSMTCSNDIYRQVRFPNYSLLEKKIFSLFLLKFYDLLWWSTGKSNSQLAYSFSTKSVNPYSIESPWLALMNTQLVVRVQIESGELYY